MVTNLSVFKQKAPSLIPFLRNSERKYQAFYLMRGLGPAPASSQFRPASTRRGARRATRTASFNQFPNSKKCGLFPPRVSHYTSLFLGVIEVKQRVTPGDMRVATRP